MKLVDFIITHKSTLLAMAPIVSAWATRECHVCWPPFKAAVTWTYRQGLWNVGKQFLVGPPKTPSPAIPQQQNQTEKT